MTTSKNKTQTLMVYFLALVFLAGCNGSDSNSANGKQTIVVKNQMDSDELANAAEQLVGPYTFMLAYKTAQMALEKNPSNLKAQFYEKFLKRTEAYRGILYRIKPILSPAEFASNEETISKYLPNSPFRKFLIDESAPQFKSKDEYQDVIGNYFQASVEFRQFLKDHQNENLELYLNPYVFESSIREELANSCEYVETPDGFKVVCSQLTVASKKLNTADFIALRQIVSAEVIYSFFNSYSLNGITKLNHFDPNGTRSNKERTEFLAAQPDFGKLRKDQTITLFRELGADYYSAMKWILASQSDVCAKGPNWNNQRRGYLFKNGLCINNESDADQKLSYLQHLLDGPAYVEIENGWGIKDSFRLDVFAWSKSPVQDLRQIQPTVWNKCDKAAQLNDNSLGGLFVDNDITKLLKTNCNL